MNQPWTLAARASPARVYCATLMPMLKTPRMNWVCRAPPLAAHSRPRGVAAAVRES